MRTDRFIFQMKQKVLIVFKYFKPSINNFALPGKSLHPPNNASTTTSSSTIIIITTTTA